MKDIAAAISERIPGAFRCASPDDLDRLRGLGLSQGVIDHYAVYEPCDVTIIGVQNHSIATMCERNAESRLVSQGYIEFAQDEDGALCCFDMNRLNSAGDPAIVLAQGYSADGCDQFAWTIAEYWRNTLDGIRMAEEDGYPID